MGLAWKRLDATREHKIAWRDIVVKHFEMPNGSVEEYGTYDKENFACVATIALTAANKVVIARQFRPGPEIIMDELPGGAVDEGEDIEEAAVRELLEETGYKPGSMKLLGKGRKDAYRNGTHYYFLAKDCVNLGQAKPDATEFIDIIEISIEQLIDNATAGKMTDAVAVLFAYKELEELTNGKST